jgi:rhodanese-related sulfurtransferase
MNSVRHFIILFFSITFILSCNNKTTSKKSVNNLSDTKIGSVLKIDGLGLLKLQKLDKNTYIVNISKPDTNVRSCKQIKNYYHLEAAKIYKNPSILPKNKTLILISEEGKESLKLANYLKNSGVTVYNFTGGLKAYFEWKDYIETQHKIRPINDDLFDGLEEIDFGC